MVIILIESVLTFVPGDPRINENAPLASMHALWLREHNRVSRTLASLNPHWRDHVLFEEARRIVIAELQHIVYAELLPAIIGSVCSIVYCIILNERQNTLELTKRLSLEYKRSCLLFPKDEPDNS